MKLQNKLMAPGTIIRDVLIVAMIVLLLLMVPFILMLTGDMDWTPGDFIAAWILLFGAGLTFKLIIRHASNKVYKAGVGVAVGTALFLIWTNLAVGLIGSEDNPANVMYLGVLAVLVIGTVLARFQSKGMAYTLFSTGFAQVLVAIAAMFIDFGYPSGTITQIAGVNGFFIMLWTVSGLLFRYAAMGLKMGESSSSESI